MKYDKLGVSAQKKDVHDAIAGLDKGLYENCFCKVLPDYSGGDSDYANIVHADTAGTKTSLAYIYWKETGDLNVWRNIIQDSIVMNIDDLACAGVTDNILFSSTIGRNRNLIPGIIIKEIIGGCSDFIDLLNKYKINIYLGGGETADVGDIVRTIDIGVTAFARLMKKEVVRINIKPGDVIVGLASSGMAVYEKDYNSGIGSNGLTFARHEILNKTYAGKYPESFDPAIDKEFVYSGKMSLTDKTNIKNKNTGQLLLSPTRTYLPVIAGIPAGLRKNIHGIIHCTGGGQTKILHFIKGIRIVKDKMFDIPEIFNLIQNRNNSNWKEMYQVFNMGHRIEFYMPEKSAKQLMDISEKFNIDARIIGYAESNTGTDVLIKSPHGEFLYKKED